MKCYKTSGKNITLRLFPAPDHPPVWVVVMFNEALFAKSYLDPKKYFFCPIPVSDSVVSGYIHIQIVWLRYCGVIYQTFLLLNNSGLYHRAV